MASYIDADAEIAKIQKEIERLKHRIESHIPDREDGWIDHESQIKHYEEEIKNAEQEIRRINSYPTADAVEVVRCKDCYWGKEVSGNIECNEDLNYPKYHEYDWYCPNGERREDARNCNP